MRPVEEPWLNERDAGIVAVRKAIVAACCARSREELGDKLPLDVDDLASTDCAFEELVNRVASRVDVPLLRKLQLLTESLPERGAVGARRSCAAAEVVIDTAAPLPPPAASTPSATDLAAACCPSAIRSTASSAPTRWRPR